jgi:SPX domain protein involved in polyphosphate accumulation
MDFLTLRMRLAAVMQRDSHAVDGKYEIRSLYFDTPSDRALREKLDGVNQREKFRIRLYNYDTSVIFLEKKSKWNNLCSKESTELTEEEVQRLLRGEIMWMKNTDRVLCRELYDKMVGQGLRPKTIVDYTREPFVFAPGNVRVTLDYAIHTGLQCTDFLNPQAVTVPAGEDRILLEVKWDEYLPDIIREAVSLESRRAGAFSKYAQCRIYG